MKLSQLDKTEYLRTMTNKMIDITDTAEAITDVWGYAEMLLSTNLLSEYDYKERFVKAVYSNSDHSYHHVLLFGSRKNIYIVIVIDVLKRGIDGHYILDLDEEYGLNEQDTGRA